MILLTILVFIIILGLLVFVHELGHFIMAKRAGMRVDEFGFGFPPRLFSVTRDETTYSINAIPLGGFVKILGEDGSDSADTRSFNNKSFLQRFAVLIAGVTMNVILAWVLISMALAIGWPTLVAENEQIPDGVQIKNVSVAVLEVAPDSPAFMAGLKPEDNIVKIADEPIDSIQEAQDVTKSLAGQPTVYTIRRGNDTFEKTITPRANPPEGQGPLGIALGSIGQVVYPWYSAPIKGAQITLQMVWLTIMAFYNLIVSALQGENVGAAISGPVGIAVLTRDMTAMGFIYLLRFTALISINLAIINAVPFPALDGGRILFLIIEKLRGKKLNMKAEQTVNALGFMLLLLLMAVVTFKDVSRYSQGFKNLFERMF